MAYHVTWAVFGPDERTLVRDAFPDTFDRHEEAVAFVLDKLSDFSSLGFDRDRGYWGRNGPRLCCETRFVIAREQVCTRASSRS